MQWTLGCCATLSTEASAFDRGVERDELIAYLDMTKLPAEALSPRTKLILTYALCGFANLGSLGIMVGGLSTMVPERRADIIELAPKAVLVGLMATLLSAALVGLITP